MLKVRFEMPAKELILWRYGHGRYADAWILVHVASGVSVGFLGLWVGLSVGWLLALSIAAYFIYELWEAWYGIVEDVENALMDVFAGGLGTGLVLWAQVEGWFDNSQLPWLFGASLLVCLLLLFIGWRVYLGRVVRKEVKRIYPAWHTPEGKLKIKKDQYLFFSLAIVSIPLPLIVCYAGWLRGFIWAAIMLIVVGLAHRLIRG